MRDMAVWLGLMAFFALRDHLSVGQLVGCPAALCLCSFIQYRLAIA